ncbi:MAG: dITP/XTP pyrophosphatase [Candidatus Nitrospira kreftii]|uniref:dITP/XTP pyrophosphatase n=1 Tax=Candidatus Nitrospira kreftii TaxID=2652173 RepID=A0A7S8IZA5_9BACT|nr:MAG: dITP/XTP pyrophosphatase [Candidatus Nitrospira kreftii]
MRLLESVNEIVLATRNPDKGRELGALLGGIGIRIRTLKDFPTAPEVEEDGTTCEANAIKKAREIARATRIPALADDTGLEVDALEGRPGVYAARYAGEHATYEDNCRKLLLELAGVPPVNRKARFLTVAAIAFPSGDVHVTQGILEGVITEQPIGERGFGYDPVFFVPEFNKTLAQLTIEEKNRTSHRAKAFTQMCAWLKEYPVA